MTDSLASAGSAETLSGHRAKLARPGYGYVRPFAEPVIAELEAGVADPAEHKHSQARLDAMFRVSHSPDGHGLIDVKQASNAYHAELGAEAKQRIAADPARAVAEAPRIAASFAARLEDGVQMTATPRAGGLELRIAPNEWWEILVGIGELLLGNGESANRVPEADPPVREERPDRRGEPAHGSQDPAHRAARVVQVATPAFGDAVARVLPGAQVRPVDTRPTFAILVGQDRFAIRLMACPLGSASTYVIVNPTKDAHVLQLSDRLTDPAIPHAVASGVAEIAGLRRLALDGKFPTDHRQRAAHETPIHEVPSPRRPLSHEEAAQLAHMAAQERAVKSATVVQRYRQLANQLRTRNDYPRVRDPQLGGGAALSATRSGQLFIDDRGRWQADPSQVIAQTAMQLRDMLPAGIGDPFLFVAHPNDRVPLTAIHFFQDRIAAQADVINGTGGIEIDDHMRVLLTIRPSDGSEAVVVQVEGTPLIASGFPHERVPDQRMGTFEAVSRLMRALEGSPAPDAAAARAALATVALTDHAAVGGVLEAYPAARQELVRRATEPQLGAALEVLQVNRAWVALRTEGADRTDRIMLGDQANLHTLNPRAALRWVITGVGGTSISAAEIILNGNPGAKVTMIGRSLPKGLNTNDQFRDVYTVFGPLGQNRFDILTDQVLGPATTRDGGASVSTGAPVSGGAKIDGQTTLENMTDPMLTNEWIALAVGRNQLLAVEHVLGANPDAKVKLVAADFPPRLLADPLFQHLVATYGPPSDRPRLDIASGAYFAALHDNSAGGFSTTGPVAGDGFVNGTGRGGQAAPIIEDLVRDAMLKGLRVVGELLWSDDRRYLGYRVRIGAGGSTRSFDVTGAASRFLPAEPVFDDRQRLAVLSQTDLDAPEESGNFDGGFVSSATQAARYARQAREDHQRADSFRLVARSGHSLDLPSGQPVTAWADSVRTFLAAELGVEPDRLMVVALAGGASPDVPFKVTLGTAELGVFKVFRNPALAQNEIDMLRIMASKHPTEYKPVAAKSDAVVNVTGGLNPRGAMLMETAQGDSVAQMVKLLPPHGHPQRGAGLLRIMDSATRVARSLADLHQGTASGEALTRDQKIGEGSDAHYLRHTKLPAVKNQLGHSYAPICLGVDQVMAEYGQDRVVVPASAYHGDANLGNFMIDDRARVKVFDVDGMQWSVDKATGKGTKTGASDLGRFIGSLGTMNLNMPNSLQDFERRMIQQVFLQAYFAANPTVRREHLEPAIKLSRVELELAALTGGAITPEAAIARIYRIVGLPDKPPRNAAL